MDREEMLLASYAQGRWNAGGGPLGRIPSAIDGRIIALVPGSGLDYGGMVRYARTVGGPNLRALTFHQRAALVKALATYLNERRDALYALSYETGATKRDHFFDIDGGIGTLFSFASKARRELPDERFAVESASPSRARSSGSPSKDSSSRATSSRPCAASRCTSMRSISRVGGCSRNSPRR
jgi:oxepin-CoA hydrolase/3-oxo-5,6-dehydrosuberyl-CoA semialdehyde dehydrogenase